MSVSTLHQILTANAVPAGGIVVLAHGLRVSGVPVLPEFIDIENPAFDVTAYTTASITVQNTDTANAQTGRFEVQFRHSIVRSDGPPASPLFTPIGTTPFIRRGSNVGAGAGNFMAFRYTVTGAEPDLSDFMINLPAVRATDNYRVVSTGATMAQNTPFTLPDSLAGDRTTTQFRLLAIAALTAGDTIDFVVSDNVP